MPRVKRGVTARARHKKVLKKAKGFRGRRGNVFRVAHLFVDEVQDSSPIELRILLDLAGKGTHRLPWCEFGGGQREQAGD